MTTHHRGGFHSWDDAARRQWQDPEAVLAGIGLQAGLSFADIGCGGGFFAVPAARLVGPRGNIYALDANPAAIAHLKEQAEKEGLSNIRFFTGRAEDTLVGERCADVVFFGMSLHDFDDPPRALANARRIVKPGGKLVDLDWKKEALPIGPPPGIKFAPEYASGLIEAAGFKVLSTSAGGPYHYLITARPV